MIVEMKRATIIMVEDDKGRSLKTLRKTGILHLEKLNGSGDKLGSLINKNQKISDAIAILDLRETPIPEQKNGAEAIALAEEILDTAKRIQNWENEIIEIEQKIEKLLPWGDFNPDEIHMLEQKGVIISLVSLDEKEAESLKSGFLVCELSRKGSTVHAAVISKGKKLPESIEPLELPEAGISSLIERKTFLKNDINSAEGKLDSYLQYDLFLKQEGKSLASECLFENVNSGMLKDSGVSWVSGYIPVSKESDLRSVAKESGWGLILQEPTEDEEVPTLLKQNPVTKLLNPLMDILGITPGYREMDISLYFLVFFSFFTAMLIGDAGYGLIFLGLCSFFAIKEMRKGNKINTALLLGIVLSISITLWGCISGTWFASKSIMNWGFFQKLQLAAFAGDEASTNDVIMYISFLLGVVQLSLACIQGFIKEFPELKAFARIGWMLVLIGMYFFVLSQVLGMVFPTAMLYVLISGIAFIIIFGNQEKGQSFIKGLVKSLINLFPTTLDVIGSFSNIMSYIRLFAVGLAGVKVAETFNAMAAPLMSPGPAIIGGIIILLLGHSLNIILGLLAVFVHAVRLNILEYSGQLGVEWSGFKYEPFKE